VAFEVRPTDVDETTSGDAEAVAIVNAERKLNAALANGDDGTTPILGVDTVVELDGRLYGKPESEEEARATLTALAGREHQVVSAMALWRADRTMAAVATTAVRFRAQDDRLLDWYLASGEWRDRAGGYAIQGRGAALVESIRGDYFNVVGLPVAALLELWPGLLGG
jgi:septum formation protein